MAVGVLDPRKGIVWQDSGSSLTPEQIEQLQALEIRKRMGGVDTSPVNHWTQGAARVVDALGGVLRERRLNNAASENQAYNAEQSAPLIEALSGASSAMASAPTSGVAQEMASTSPAPNVAPEIASGIVETASALGIDPVDLGTAISYETAGTFDPTKAGPTTQWGQHKGLIQFGEPQAKQYGVDWNNPVGSQLGANGAVANYLRSTGVKPGMGMMDIYSAINAGRVGRYGASDANNGGAPGTVADKVNQQMAGHRAKAMALLGDNGNPGSMSPERAASYSSRLGTPYQPAQAAIEQVAPSGYVDPAVSVQPQAMAPEQAGFDSSRFDSAPAPMAGGPEIYSTQSDFAPELPAPVNVAPAPTVAAVQQAPSQAQVAPQAPATNTAAIAQALRVMSDPRANEGTRRVAQVLLQQEQQKQAAAQEQAVWQQRQQYEQQQQNSDPLRQLQIQKAQQELAGGSRQSLVNAGDGRIYDPNSQQWIQAPNSGQTKAPETQTFYDEQGREYRAQWNPTSSSWERVGGSKLPSGMTIRTNPDGTFELIQGQGSGGNLTEAQSKDAVYSTRARGALTTLDKFDTALTSLPERAAEYDPTGLSRSVQSPEFQQARQSGDEFLQAILRKDTGAAITSDEMASYGRTYLPAPGDGPELLAQKRVARSRALAALESGMPPQAILNQEKALEKSSKPESARSDDISRAKAAIARGANREAVIKRLQDAGISTEGL